LSVDAAQDRKAPNEPFAAAARPVGAVGGVVSPPGIVVPAGVAEASGTVGPPQAIKKLAITNDRRALE